MDAEARQKVKRLISDAEDHLSNVESELDHDLDQAGLAADYLVEAVIALAALMPVAPQPPASTEGST